jgi:AcrR family transcriptional regulator
MSSSEPLPAAGRQGAAPIKQRRGQRTFDALVETGLALARERGLDAVSVAEIAKQAGYSVGAFYARFTTKDDFHRALVERHSTLRIADFDTLFETTGDEELITRYFDRQIERMAAYASFWRSCLQRGFTDPEFWEPFRRIARRVGDGFVERASRRIGRSLTSEEELNIRFAIQVTNGAINNTLINRPGPITVEDPDFKPRLARAFRRVSDWDELA